MYIPNVNYSVYELVDNSVDQYIAGNGDTINIWINSEGVLTVQDFGAGMPIGESQDVPGMSQAELAFSRLQAGGKFEDNGIKSAGLIVSPFIQQCISKNSFNCWKAKCKCIC
jgi:DNA gyrase/topoisomerase IV subunit B